jgi:hypothetical protein
MNRFILHPFLAPLFPVIALYLNNLTSLSPAMLVRPIIVLELISLLSWAALARLFRNTRAAAVTVSLLMFIFFLHIEGSLGEMLVIWFLSFIVLALVVRKNPARLAKFSAPLNVVVITLLLLQSARYVHSVRHSALEAEKVAIVTVQKPDRESLPNIVHIILDGFGRPDLINQKFGSDVQFLVNHLNTNGFFVAGQARANYMQTMQSVASSFSMNYLPGSAKSDANDAPLSRTQLSRVVENSPVRRELVRLGYRVEGSVATASKLNEWSTTTSHEGFLSMAEDILIQKSCLGPLVQFLSNDQDPRGEAALRAHYARVRGEFETATNFVRQEGPAYQILHIVSPHPPFVFAADGSYRAPEVNGHLMFGDASHFLMNNQSWADYEEGYGGQVQWVAAATCRLVERILQESERPVAIIIQGDHGPGLRHDWASSEASDLDCRSGILFAIRLPNQVSELAPEYQSPVNIYRYLFNELWGGDLPLLPTRVFYSTWGEPDVFEDVSTRIKNK